VQLLVALVQNLPLIMTTVARAVPQIIGALVSAFAGNIGLMAETGLSLITGLKDAFTSINWGSVGMDIIRGIAGGISGAAGGLWDAAKSVLGGFKDNVLGFFGIHSPSRWGRDAVGRWIPRGIAGGIEEDAYTMQDALTEAANSLSIDTSHLGATIDPNNINVADYNSQQSNSDLEESEKNNTKAGDVFNITLQALGELSDIQLMEMARKLVVFIKELKDRDDSPRGGVFNV
jgi:phage-related protein